jgi:hypothetical protein
MRAGLAVTLLLLLVAVIGAVIAPVTSPWVAATNHSSGENATINRIAHLTAGNDASAALTNGSLDAASAVSIGRDDAAARLDDYATEERIGRTSDANATLDAALDAVAVRVDALEADAQSVRGRYANGSMSAPRFVRETAHLQARSDRLGARLSRLERAAAAHGTPAHRERIDRLERRLLGYDGPVRARTLGAVTGTRGSIELYAAGSSNGSVLATIDGSEYVRDAHRPDRQAASPEGISIGEAFDRFEEVYPVAIELPGFVGVQSVDRSNETYQFEKRFPYGSIVALLDGNTRDVFRETQYRGLDDIDQPASATATGNGTRLVVNRTHVGGPLRVATVNASDGNATPSTVRVGDRRLETGDDGVVRTLMPPRSRVQVTATTPEETVTVTIEPIKLTPVNATGGP